MLTLDPPSPGGDSPPTSTTIKGSGPRPTRSAGLRPHLGRFGGIGTGKNFPSRVRVIGPLLFAVKSVVFFGCGGGGGGVEVEIDLGGGLTRRFFVGGSSMGSKSSARALPRFGTTGSMRGYRVGS